MITKFPTVRNMDARLAKLATLSRGEFVKLRDAIESASSAMSDIFIAADRGYWRPNNEIAHAAARGDAMCLHYRALEDARLAVFFEGKHRLRMHGSYSPYRA